MLGRLGAMRLAAATAAVLVVLGGVAYAVRSSDDATGPTAAPSSGLPSASADPSPSATSADPSPSDTTADPSQSLSAAPSASPTTLGDAVAQRQQELGRLATKAQRYSDQRRRERPVAEFTFANFNVQGASHRGNVPLRTSLARDLLVGHGVDVAALQEFAPANRNAFARVASGTYDRFPTAGRGLDMENSIIWRRDRFELVKGETRPYPYFRGATRNMPRVLLRDKRSGASFWVTSYHNPATCCGYGNQARFRASAVSRQIADANALRAATKHPLIVSGDMNDRASYFCRMGPGAAMHSADGSTSAGGCRVAGHLWIDWILGTKDVQFSDYVRDDGRTADRASDHPIVVTKVKVTGLPGEGAQGSDDG